jgi:kynurenine formamidase
MPSRLPTRLLASACGVLFVALALLGCQPASSPDEASPAFPSGTVVDLTYAFTDSSVYWPTAAQEFTLTPEFEGTTDAGYYYSAYAFSASEHGGTHMDAPKHFHEGGAAAHDVPLDRLMGPAIVIDVSEQALDDPDYQVSVDDFEAWETEHGRIPDGTIVLVRTGYGQYYPDRERYMGTAERGEDALADLHFPGLHPTAAQWLVDNRSIHAIGFDTPSLDYGQSAAFEAHQILFEDGIAGFENLANLDQLPPQGFHVLALPMKIEGGSGGPARIIAILPESDDA